jgi:uncharacterized protein YggE
MFSKARAFLIMSTLAVLLVSCMAVQAGPQSEPQVVSTPAVPQTEREITVVGVGRVNLVPNVAKISVGAETRASTVSEAKDQVDRQMEAIAVALEELGIDEKDIQTAHYSIYYEQESYQPFSREEGAAAEPQGVYRVSSMLEVTVRNVERAGEVLDGVVAAGANQVYGVSFTVSDDQKWQSEAREKAMADARSRAGELAGLAGAELGDVLSISEVIGGGVVMAYAERAMGGGGGIAPGEMEMTTQVQVTFALQ